jgi:hypothetical protein
MWHDILTNFMKIGKGVQAILRFGPSNLKGSNVHVTDGGDLYSIPLKRAQMA